MKTPMLLWVDLRSKRPPSRLYDRIREIYDLRYIDDIAALASALGRVLPCMLCFDFDYPDHTGLRALQQTKLLYPSIPILMLTEYHSEALAIWAFRTRVWDYLVKPVGPEDVTCRVLEITKISKPGGARKRSRCLHRADCPIPSDLLNRTEGPSRTLLPAVAYVEANYQDKISLTEMARHCDMGPYQFSRAFKQAKGITFREFLLQFRISKAMTLMKNPRANITEIAFAVGFNDLSHFAYMFRRYTGLSPSRYRQQKG